VHTGIYRNEVDIPIIRKVSQNASIGEDVLVISQKRFRRKLTVSTIPQRLVKSAKDNL
jgi:hypothetical protein